MPDAKFVEDERLWVQQAIQSGLSMQDIHLRLALARVLDRPVVDVQNAFMDAQYVLRIGTDMFVRRFERDLRMPPQLEVGYARSNKNENEIKKEDDNGR